MFEDHLYWLDQIHTSQRLLVGDKAFYLGLLAQRGYPVVPGFVISSAIFQSFLEQIEWAEPMFADLPYSSLHVDVDSPRQLQTVAQQIRKTLKVAPLPEDWLRLLEEAIQPWQASALIFRPSIALPSGFDPTVSLKATGLLEARVCQANKEDIAQSLKQVWTELFRAKSLLYWQRLRIQPQQINFAVLIQPIANVIASGDVQIQDKHLDIRAIWGLGKGLTSGEVMPDLYQVDLQTGTHAYQAAAKLYAYQLAPGTDQVAAYISFPNCYHPVLVEPLQQIQPVLDEVQLQHLIHLTQQTAIDLGSHLELEWILIDQKQAPPTFHLTQVTPDLKQKRWSRELNPLKPTEDQFSVSPVSARSLPSSPVSAPPLLTGLAAAPGTIVAPAWVNHQSIPPQLNTPNGADLPAGGIILVAPNITPDWLPWIKQAVAIVTEQGGMTSHGAILAREIGIPAITGALNATQLIQTGDRLLIDGDRGEVYKVAEQESGQKEPGLSVREPGTLYLNPQFLPDRPPTQIATQLLVMLSQTDALARVTDLPIDGVGLLRSELMLLEVLEQHHPDWWVQQGQQAELTDRLAQQIQQFAQVFAPRPVFYRSTDLRSHEFSHLAEAQQSIAEPNPMLGLRGTWRYQTDPALFEIELAALRQVQQQGYTNVHLILPFVRTVEEFQFCRQKIEQIGLTQNSLFQLWIMAEVPSVLLLLPDYIQAGVQGIAIGINDLTQLILGVDRDQPQLATAFNSLHPAVMKAIQQLIQTARQAEIPCSICGHATGQYPEMIEALVRWGITAISVNPDEVMSVRQTIVRAEYRLLLDAARQQL